MSGISLTSLSVIPAIQRLESAYHARDHYTGNLNSEKLVRGRESV